MKGFLKFTTIEGGVSETLMVFATFVLVLEFRRSLSGLWLPQHRVTFYFHNDFPRDGVETPLFLHAS